MSNPYSYFEKRGGQTVQIKITQPGLHRVAAPGECEVWDCRASASYGHKCARHYRP